MGGLGGVFWFFQAEDGIRDVERSRGLGDVYKRQHIGHFKITARGDTHTKFFTQSCNHHILCISY